MSAGSTYDAVVVGGGPAGATAAGDLAAAGFSVALLDRGGRIKPCGGAVPPRLIKDFAIPDHLIAARINRARMIAPSDKQVDMPIEDGYVGMVDREHFDEWLRERARLAGAARIEGQAHGLDRDGDGAPVVCYRSTPGGAPQRLRARVVIGADGARSRIAAAISRGERTPCVFAYHEIVRLPASHDGRRCDVYYQGELSPDFYGWVFPHGDTASVGVGSAQKGFSLRGAVTALRERAGLAACELVRAEGAPIPLRALKRWDNGRDIVLAGDAAGVVAPASGEGIYYAMAGGAAAATAAGAFLGTGDARALATARRGFMQEHGRVFWILGVMQHFWYRSDRRRERFVTMCRDPDVQRLTWEAYLNKKLAKPDPGAHMRIFLKDMGHLLGLSAP